MNFSFATFFAVCSWEAHSSLWAFGVLGDSRRGECEKHQESQDSFEDFASQGLWGGAPGSFLPQVSLPGLENAEAEEGAVLVRLSV